MVKFQITVMEDFQPFKCSMYYDNFMRIPGFGFDLGFFGLLFVR